MRKYIWIDLVHICICPNNSRPYLDKVKAELLQHFKMKDMGPAKYIVGLEIHQDGAHRTLHLNQYKYNLDGLKWFNMENCNPV